MLLLTHSCVGVASTAAFLSLLGFFLNCRRISVLTLEAYGNIWNLVHFSVIVRLNSLSSKHLLLNF